MSKILIIDDDDGLRQIYARYLSAEGHEILEAHTVEKALEFRNECPDIVLLDIQLQEDGAQGLMAVLREACPQAKVIIFSCFDIHFQKRTIANADEYFNKTEGCRALSQKIKTVLA